MHSPQRVAVTKLNIVYSKADECVMCLFVFNNSLRNLIRLTHQIHFTHFCSNTSIIHFDTPVRRCMFNVSMVLEFALEFTMQQTDPASCVYIISCPIGSEGNPIEWK